MFLDRCSYLADCIDFLVPSLIYLKVEGIFKRREFLKEEHKSLPFIFYAPAELLLYEVIQNYSVWWKKHSRQTNSESYVCMNNKKEKLLLSPFSFIQNHPESGREVSEIHFITSQLQPPLFIFVVSWSFPSPSFCFQPFAAAAISCSGQQ